MLEQSGCHDDVIIPSADTQGPLIKCHFDITDSNIDNNAKRLLYSFPISCEREKNQHPAVGSLALNAKSNNLWIPYNQKKALKSNASASHTIALNTH